MNEPYFVVAETAEQALNVSTPRHATGKDAFQELYDLRGSPAWKLYKIIPKPVAQEIEIVFQEKIK